VAKLFVRISGLLIVPTLAIAFLGCSGTEKIPLKEMDYQLKLPTEEPKPEQLPKHLRPPKGTTAGMNRDPTGMSGGNTAPPPQ